MKMTDWDQVRDWLDSHHSISPRIAEQINTGQYPSDAFTVGQMASKAWLLQYLNTFAIAQGVTVSILGNWIGTLVDPILRNHPTVERIYGIDTDPVAVELSERLNAHWHQHFWRYKGVVADASVLDSSLQVFETSGELIEVRPDIIINTSAEHMDEHWFHTANSDQLVIMQTNSNPNLDGHINICTDIEDVKQRYPMQPGNIAVQFEMPDYTRFMQIGYPDHE